MKVVLDTNVIIAAFATRGLCAEVFEVCLTKCEIILSEHILHEVAQKLVTKIHLPKPIVQEILQFLREHSQIVKPEAIEISILKDQKDLPVIGTAVRSNAQLLITGDKELLNLGKFEGVEILSPR
ncbi:putative toxin-antitoxin system toxin component, PIN family, partial [Thermosulfurimonas sp.]|uniref:putative toxin-antitoxin system toxin component, PIN family n=1 Tax=Thermosulfurimonas sp. TaxID=2080236 RepID=UPI0025FBFBCA